ncbi:MAG: tetratricopeptide repeat protein [Opitutae bacterium]|nr:tetratricopeptide repeat protein [Opitutae bacterium]
MEKSLNRAAAVTKSASSTWVAFTAIGLCGGLIGATATYLALRPKLSVTPIAAASLAKTVTDPSAHLPPPELTAGQPPAQAERTLGNFYYDHQNWPAAIRSYQAALKQGSDDADIRTDLGNAYRFSQRPDDALVQYQLAQKMNPAHEFSLFNQGGLYLEDLHQPQKAVTAWREYLRRFPTGQNVASAQQWLAHAETLLAESLAGPRANPTTANQADMDKLLRLLPPSGQPK